VVAETYENQNGSVTVFYLSPYSTILAADLDDHRVGLLITPQSHRPNQYGVAGFVWAADNGCFTLGDRFELGEYLEWLDTFCEAEREACLFATAPDVVGDWSATLERSTAVDERFGCSPLEAIRWLGYPAAIVLQDGATVDSVPWSEIDAVFVGGSTEWKLSPAAAELMAEAEARGKWAHMGRVNSRKRTLLAAELGAHSADGTYIVFGPTTNGPKLARWANDAAEMYGDVAA
jgi:hypothetical protein